jgi:DNA-binding IclR family transcriptional regulator
MTQEQSMQTIERAIQILKSFSIVEKELSLADLHRKLGISKSSLQRILNTLVLHGLIDKDREKKTYRLGMELYFLGQLVEKNTNLLLKSKPYMIRLNKKFGEMVSLNIIYENKKKCIGYIPSNHELMTITYVGQESPLYAGASSKVLLAFLPDKERDELIETLTLEPLTEDTIVDKTQLKQELKKIRAQGYAISVNESVKGAFMVSAPVKNRFDEVIAAVSMGMPTVRVDESKIEVYVHHVLEAAALITQELKH